MALIHTENLSGNPIWVDGYSITHVERSVRLQPPGLWGILLWRRPSNVIVHHPDGNDEILQIQDPTRKAQFFLLGLGLVGSLLVYLLNKVTKARR